MLGGAAQSYVYLGLKREILFLSRRIKCFMCGTLRIADHLNSGIIVRIQIKRNAVI